MKTEGENLEHELADNRVGRKVNTGQSQLEIQKLERVEMGLSDNNKSQNQGRPEYEKAEAENEILGGAKDGASKVDGCEEEDLSDHTLTGGSE